MSNINDVRPLCEVIKDKEDKNKPQLSLFKKVNGSNNYTDNLLEATSAYYKYKDKTELIFEV
jgi:hypothetical protein